VITWIIIDNIHSLSPFQYNGAFSEDTQRGTDRLIRNIIQDLTELDREAIVKPGKQRSEVKVKAVEKRLNAAADALEQLSAFIVK
jgi:cob(I)alamin adenosyltransferase